MERLLTINGGSSYPWKRAPCLSSCKCPWPNGKCLNRLFESIEEILDYSDSERLQVCDAHSIYIDPFLWQHLHCFCLNDQLHSGFILGKTIVARKQTSRSFSAPTYINRSKRVCISPLALSDITNWSISQQHNKDVRQAPIGAYAAPPRTNEALQCQLHISTLCCATWHLSFAES